MTALLFRNRITALFSIRHPILLGGMHQLGRFGVVAAVVNAGAMGFITPRSFDDLQAYRDDLRRCRDLTQGRTFGVNLTISRRPGFHGDAPAWIGIALEEGVRHFESAGTSPEAIVGPIHAGGGVLMHKCPSVRHALTAERLGVDAVALVGMEEGGYPGANQLPTFVNGAVAVRFHCGLPASWRAPGRWPEPRHRRGSPRGPSLRVALQWQCAGSRTSRRSPSPAGKVLHPFRPNADPAHAAV